jgi:hypothetical protein
MRNKKRLGLEMEVSMEKVIYDNQSSKLIANISGDIVELTQYLEGEITGNISLYVDEFRDLNLFVNENYVEGLDYDR